MRHTRTSYHAQSVEDVLEALEVTPEDGLSAKSIAARQEAFGANRIRTSRRRSILHIWFAQLRSLVVGILAAAAVLAFLFGEFTEGVAITAVILINSLIGFVSEWRAARSMEALRRMGTRRVRVHRDGEDREVPATDLVPGDICLHEGGDMLSADLRLIEANSLQLDESTLTGESVSVAKQIEPVRADQPLPARTNMLYRGTTITEGSAVGVVVATGMNTELGHIAEMAEDADTDQGTPLERSLGRLAHRLAWVSLGAGAVVGAAGLLSGKPTVLMIETAIALGVAAIPEGLPFVATIALARGMWFMAHRQALVNRLPAVETLGATNVILSDKTGTLTENRMVVATLVTPAGEYDLQRIDRARQGTEDGRPESDPLYARCLAIGALCNNASIRGRSSDGEADESRGDPTEIALLICAARQGIDRAQLLENEPEVREEAFEARTMMMATVHELNGRFRYAVKGAPRAVLERCTTVGGSKQASMTAERRDIWNGKARALARRGLRVLALADKEEDTPDAEPYARLSFAGLIGMSDPPREDVRKSLEDCRRAGIHVVMATGDQPETARAIAAELGLVDEKHAAVLTGEDLDDAGTVRAVDQRRILESRIFARVSPEQKLRLLTLFQERGDTVAMTGDGVNDAPALKKADIGVAMGKRGTDAARDSADMVLKNDAFSSILAAVQQGRVIFSNIRKSVVFMLCTNVAEVAVVGIASLLGWPLPIRPLQILFLNVITDVLPALALSAGRGDPEKAMQRPPRDSREPVLGRRQWLAVGGWSAAISVCVLGALLVGIHILHLPVAQAVTVSFLALAFAKLWFVLNLREPGTSILRNDIVGNPWMWCALSACILFLFAAVYVPGLSSVLETEYPGLGGWLVILAFSTLPVLAGQLRLRLKKNVAP